MPTYVYKCKKCGKTFEIMKSITKYDEVEKCNECGIEATRQISNGSGIIFKGTGFYQTDYKNKGL